jgi:hypothetical protein
LLFAALGGLGRERGEMGAGVVFAAGECARLIGEWADFAGECAKLIGEWAAFAGECNRLTGE